jgi:hypothetical protein
MSDDLVKRLRVSSAYKAPDFSTPFVEPLKAEAADRIEELEAKLAESEARSEVLETLIMDVAADLYDGVDAHKIDQRIGDVMKQLDEEGEDQ